MYQPVGSNPVGSNRSRTLRKHRGIALVIVLSMVVLVAFAVAFAITVASKDVRDSAKQIHNLTIQNVTEGAMQEARAFFSRTCSNGTRISRSPIHRTPPSTQIS